MTLAAPIALLLAASGGAPRETALQREADSIAGRLPDAPDPLAAAQDLLRIEELLPDLGSVATPLRAVDEAAERWRASRGEGAGEVVALAERVGLLLELARGRPVRAADRERRLGLATSWAVRSEEWTPGGTCLPAEPPAPFGDGRGWRLLPDITRAGRLDLDALLSDRRTVAALGAVELDLARSADVAFYYGASGPSALAVDGAWIAADAASHPARDGQLRVPLRLSSGAHLVELRVCRANRPIAASLRIAAASGAPLAGASLSLPGPQVAHLAPGAARAPVVPERGGLLLAAARAEGARGMPARAALVEALAPDDMAASPPAEVRRQACEAEKANAAPAAELVTCWLRLARDEELARRSIERQEALAAARAEGLATESLALAEGREALDLGYPERALRAALRAGKLAPDDDRPLLVKAEALEALGLSGMAARVEIDASHRFPWSPDAEMAGAYRLERLGRRGEAIEKLQLLLGLRPDMLGARESLVRLLQEREDEAGVLEQLAAEHALVPASARPLIERAELLLANPRGGNAGLARRAQAQEDLRAAMLLAPDNADILGDVARAELQAGEARRGREALRRALALRPQAQGLRALAAVLSERGDDFASPWLADLSEAARRDPPTPGEDAAVLSDVTAIRVYPSGLASRIHQTIVRVQTDRGVEAARVTPIEYDPDRQEVHVESARLLRPDGVVSSTYEESTRSLSEPWYDLYYDHRELDVSFSDLSPGDVLEVTWRVDDIARENLLADEFGDLTFLADTVDRDRFAYVVEMPAGRPLFANSPDVPDLSASVEPRADGGRTYVWRCGKVEKIQSEPQMPGWADVAPYLHVSTERTWAAVGDLYWTLLRDPLAPTDRIQTVARSLMAAAGASLAARVQAAYDYVVSQTRYVGLEFGIHGYQPYPAADVLARGFGDCKDKATLLHSLLAAMGIDSRLTLLRTRRLGRIGGFPASLAVFDHAILYVPALDRFLDGTARFFGSEELPAEDQGASALVIEPGGKSRLVTTPFTSADRSGTHSDVAVRIAADGSALLLGKARIEGIQAADYRRSYQSELGRRAIFEQGWSRLYPGLTVQKVSFASLGTLEQPVTVNFELAVPHLAVPGGTGWSFDPFGSGPSYVETYAPLSRRQFPVALPPPAVTWFSYRCEPPPGTRFGPVPPDVALDAPFGRLRLGYKLELGPAGTALVVAGELVLATAWVAPAQYEAFRRFLAATDRAFERPVTILGLEKR